MFTCQDIRPLSAAVASATVVGLVFGLWLTLPTLPTPAQAEPEVASQIDPNLANYRRMIADNDISATPYILSLGYEPKAPTSPEPVERLDAAPADPEPAPARGDAVQPDPAAQIRAQRIAWATLPQRPEATAPEPADRETDPAPADPGPTTLPVQ